MPVQSVNFDASTSTGLIAYYLWILGDGSEILLDTPFLNYTYSLAGTYHVTLYVFGDYGTYDFVEHDVTVRGFDCVLFDFTIDEQGFVPYVNVAAEDAAVYVPGVGWQNNPAAVVSHNVAAIYNNLLAALEIFSFDIVYSHTEDYVSGANASGSIYPAALTPPVFPVGGQTVSQSGAQAAGDYEFEALFPSSVNALSVYSQAGQFLAGDTVTIMSISVCYFTS